MLVFSLMFFLSPSERLAVFIPNADSVGGNIPFADLVRRYGLDKPPPAAGRPGVVGVRRVQDGQQRRGVDERGHRRALAR
jgi:hypothetical protein